MDMVIKLIVLERMMFIDTHSDELDFGWVHRVMLTIFMSKKLATSFYMILTVVLAFSGTLTDVGVVWNLISAGLWPHAMALVLTSWGSSLILLPGVLKAE